MRKTFDLVFGLVTILIGVGLGLLFLKTMDFDHFAFNRKLVFTVMVPVVIIGTGVRRILMKHGPPSGK